jgi:hypothetical protein
MSTSFYNVDMHDGEKTLSSTMSVSEELLTPGECLRQFTNSHVLQKFYRWVHESENILCEGDGKTVRVSFSKLIEFCLNPQLVIFRSKHIARLRAFGCTLERMRRLGTLPDTDEIIHIHVPQSEQDAAESERFASMNIFENKQQVLLSYEPQSCSSSSTKSSSSFISSGSGTLSEGSTSSSSSSSSTSSSSGLSVASDESIVHVQCDDSSPVKHSKRTRTSTGSDQDGESPRIKKRARLNEGTHASPCRHDQLDPMQCVSETNILDAERLIEEHIRDEGRLIEANIRDADRLVEEKIRGESRVIEEKIRHESRLMEEKIRDQSRLLEEKIRDQSRLVEEKIRDQSRLVEEKIRDQSRLIEAKIRSDDQWHDAQIKIAEATAMS